MLRVKPCSRAQLNNLFSHSTRPKPGWRPGNEATKVTHLQSHTPSVGGKSPPLQAPVVISPISTGVCSEQFFIIDLIDPLL